MLRYLLLMFLMAWPIVSQAQYTFHTIDVPFAGVNTGAVTGVTAGDVIGIYKFPSGGLLGFLKTCAGPVFTWPFLMPKAVSPSGVVGGWYSAADRTWGFVLRDGKFDVITGPKGPDGLLPRITEIHHVSDTAAVGAYMHTDGVFHGFRYTFTPAHVQTIDLPDSIQTTLLHISPLGRILVRAVGTDSVPRFFLWDNGTVTPVTLPSLAGVYLVGRLDSGLLVGNSDSGPFTWDGTSAPTLLTVPGGRLTSLNGTTDAGLLYGQFDDDTGTHGFVAIPDTLPADLCDLPERHGDKPERHGDKPERGSHKPR